MGDYDYLEQIIAAEESRIREEKQKKLNEINAFMLNPDNFSRDEQMRIALDAHQLGIGDATKTAAKNDKPSTLNVAKAIGGGVLDSLLFGLLKNDWYEEENTKDIAKYARLGGDVASFLLPWGMLGGAAKGTKALYGASKALKLGKAAAGTAKVTKVAKAAVTGARATKETARLAKLARGLVGGAKAGKSVLGVRGVGDAIKILSKAGVGNAIKGGVQSARTIRNIYDVGDAIDQPYQPDYTDYQKLLQWWKLMEDLKSGEMNTMMVEEQ
jgi:hypothetical protein